MVWNRRARDYNVLVAPDDHERILGVIDFGDMLHAPLVGEVGTAAAFHMTGCADPFEGPAQFVGAYHAILPLAEAEQEIVADLMATRHLVTALISEWSELPEDLPACYPPYRVLPARGRTWKRRP